MFEERCYRSLCANAISIFTDLLVAALPILLIGSLRVLIRQRLALILIFGLGIIVNVVDSVHTMYI